MKSLILTLLMAVTWTSYAQTKVTERISVESQKALHLEFNFADDIVLKTWEKSEVYVEVSVNINDGKDDDIFELEIIKSKDEIVVELKEENWKDLGKGDDCCCTTSDLNYTVYFPADLQLNIKTLSGNIEMSEILENAEIKTISGDIDVTVSKSDLDFLAKTITGEIYSDLDIIYPEGKDGLHKMVGMEVNGRIGRGGPKMNFETISGDIFLRKG